jgi:glutamate-1-semialdehyde 2,1-aminomutase/spore coat polysaccharide biosynthesis protein SpsF
MSAAVRAARAYTGSDRVLVSGYHGWHDWYIATTTRNRGVPEVVTGLVATFPFDDLGALDEALEGGPTAAVIVEPSGATVPSAGYLQGVVDLAREHGAVSVFDEIITGFRLAPGGARQHYGVQPDISCYGKALGNGMPISAVGGTWDVMRVFEDVFYSGTHGGETLSLAAAAAVLDAVADGRLLEEIRRRGQTVRDGIAERIEHHGVGTRVTVGGEPQRAVVGFVGPDPLVDKSWVQQCLAEHGVLFNGSMFICARHSDADVQRALDGLGEAFAALGRGEDVRSLLKGPPVQPVFRDP